MTHRCKEPALRDVGRTHLVHRFGDFGLQRVLLTAIADKDDHRLRVITGPHELRLEGSKGAGLSVSSCWHAKTQVAAAGNALVTSTRSSAQEGNAVSDMDSVEKARAQQHGRLDPK